MFRVGFPLVTVIVIVIWALTIANIIRTPEGMYRTGNQIVWLLVVILVPFIGVPLYWILGSPTAR